MLFPTPESGWKPKVYTSSAVTKSGLAEVWKGVGEFLKFVRHNGFYAANRNRQNQYWMRETIDEALRANFYHDPEIERLLPEYREQVLADRKSSFVAAHELLDTYYKKATPSEMA
jgi:LAO/AO transport system kinase